PVLASAPSLQTPFGSLGGGVFFADVSRLHDAFADAAYRRHTASASEASTRNGVLGRIEQLYGELSDAGLASALDAFWSAWSDLRDARGRARDRLAELVDIQVVEHARGDVSVIIDNATVVDGTLSWALEVRATGGFVALAMAEGMTTLPRPGGRVGALLSVLNQDIPEQMAQLDALAAALVQEVIALHRAGTNPAGATGVDFFDPAGVTASSIRLSAAVEADIGQIAAGSGDAAGNYQAGANDVALKIAALRDEPLSALGVSAVAYYNRMLVDLGARVASAAAAADAADTLAAAASARRESVRGVSLEEELVTLMRHQS